MYEMYPDDWVFTADRPASSGDKPRRRVRKEHSVLPDVIAHQVQLGADQRRPPLPGR